MDHEPKAVRVQSPFGRPREPSILVAVIAAFLLIALLKPWSFGDDRSRWPADRGRAARRPPAVGPDCVAGEPSLATTPSILDPNAMACLTDATEQVVIIERWAGHEVRSWVAAADMTVSDPLDERLVPISIFSTHVIGLGVCAPRAIGGGPPAARLLDVQAIVQAASGRRAVDLGEPERISLESSDPEPAVLYGAPYSTRPSPTPALRRLDSNFDPNDPQPTSKPPTSSGGPVLSAADLATWPTGSYAIGFRFATDGTGIVRWLRIDLIKGAGAAG